MDSQSCPAEEDLLAFLAGDGSAATTQHVAQCARCNKSLKTLRDEATILQQIDQGESIRIAASHQATMPAMIGKYIVVGPWDAGTAFTTLRGLHAIVHQEVLIQWSNVPLADDSGAQELFTAALGMWMQHRPHVVTLLDSGIFGSRPYIVVKFDGQARLDRLHEDEKPDVKTSLRIFGQIATTLSKSIEAPHPFLSRSSIVIDDASEVTLVDWPAATIFGSLAKTTSPSTVRLLAQALWETLFDEPIPPTSSTEDLARQLFAKKIPSRASELLARAIVGPLDQLPTMSEMGMALTSSFVSKGWYRLLARLPFTSR